MRYLSLILIYKLFNACFYSRDKQNKPFSEGRRFRYFPFIPSTEENLISQRYDVANGIHIFKASATNSGYSFLHANQTVSNSSDKNYNCKVLIADTSNNWTPTLLGPLERVNLSHWTTWVRTNTDMQYKWNTRYWKWCLYGRIAGMSQSSHRLEGG
jgi:hypothetical protein